MVVLESTEEEVVGRKPLDDFGSSFSEDRKLAEGLEDVVGEEAIVVDRAEREEGRVVGRGLETPPKIFKTMSRGSVDESCSSIISDVITDPDLPEIRRRRGVVRSIRIVGQKELTVLDVLEIRAFDQFREERFEGDPELLVDGRNEFLRDDQKVTTRVPGDLVE